METVIFEGKIDHTNSYWYKPFLVSGIVLISVFYFGFCWIYISVLILIVLIDYLAYLRILKTEIWQIIKSEEKLFFKIISKGNLANSFEINKIDFRFRQNSTEGFSKRYKLGDLRRVSDFGRKDSSGPGQTRILLFSKITGIDKEIIFADKLMSWAEYPNGWRYEWRAQEPNLVFLPTFNLKKFKVIMDKHKDLSLIHI